VNIGKRQKKTFNVVKIGNALLSPGKERGESQPSRVSEHGENGPGEGSQELSSNALSDEEALLRCS